MQEHKEEIAAAKEQARLAKRKKLMLDAREAVDAFKPTNTPYRDSGLSEAWILVLRHMMKTMEVQLRLILLALCSENVF